MCASRVGWARRSTPNRAIAQSAKSTEKTSTITSAAVIDREWRHHRLMRLRSQHCSASTRMTLSRTFNLASSSRRQRVLRRPTLDGHLVCVAVAERRWLTRVGFVASPTQLAHLVYLARLSKPQASANQSWASERYTSARSRATCLRAAPVRCVLA